MKIKSYSTRFVPLVVLLLVVHILLVYLNVFPFNFRLTLISDFALLFIFLLGVPIVSVGLKKKEEGGFVGSFLILTTVQMLSTLSVLGAFVYTQVPQFREISLQLISVFIILLIVQSIFLIKLVK